MAVIQDRPDAFFLVVLRDNGIFDTAVEDKKILQGLSPPVTDVIQMVFDKIKNGRIPDEAVLDQFSQA